MITFNFKKEKVKKEEEFPNYPVLIQLPYTGEKNEVAKFQLSSKALTMLGYPEDLRDCRISIAREQGTNAPQLILVNTTGAETLHQYNVNRDGSFNSQFLSKKLEKYYLTNPSEKVVFTVEQLADEDMYAGVIKLYNDTSCCEKKGTLEAVPADNNEIDYEEFYVDNPVMEESLI